METATTTSGLLEKVEEALNSIRPYLETDGGNLKVLEITDEMVVKVELLGACGACPMSTMTMKAGIEQAIVNAVPEIKAVEAVNITAPDDPNARLPHQA